MPLQFIKEAWRRIAGTAKSSGPTVRFWNDLSPYKKIYVAMGFYELDRRGELCLDLVPYDILQKEGAPPMVEGI